MVPLLMTIFNGGLKQRDGVCVSQNNLQWKITWPLSSINCHI